MYNLIITSDDYGMCPEVDRAIEACLRAGAVRSTCAMSNMIGHDDLRTLLCDLPNASVGLHWTLTQGRPVLSAAEVSSLVSSNGEFHAAQQFRHRWLTGRIKACEVKSELEAQCRRFRETAEPDFWNTHQNVHVLPGMFGICMDLANELGIRSMRCHRRAGIPDNPVWRAVLAQPLRWLKGEILNFWSGQAEKRGMVMPQARIPGPQWDVDRSPLDQIGQQLALAYRDRPMELVVHPAVSVNTLFFRSMKETRVLEYQFYSDASLVERFRDAGIQLLSFRELRYAV